MNNTQALADFEARLGHVFGNAAFMNLALTHASTGADHNYERLEFLGDRVLGLVMAQILYETFQSESEGDLARRHAALVSGVTLAMVAEKIALGEVLRVSSAERAAGGAKNENILADVMEALIGAIYLDSGIEACKGVIAALWQDVLFTMHSPPMDAKTELQEWAQARGLPLPRYDMTARDGPDHAPIFTVSVMVEGFAPVAAAGSSRRAAEKAAATALLHTIQGTA